ncbi:MAG: hypothetical protein JO352_23270 [Chloroflexi bacterium]|nr:hypothetical protein [Chloroflexota bacterium]
MSAHPTQDTDVRGAADTDFLALGLGGTSMMSMLWTIALGHRAVGVEMRGDPFLGVHWNIRADLYHQLGLIDRLMLERYGEERLPRRGDSDKLFRLAETLYSTETRSGDIVADEVIDGFDSEQHIVGTIHHVEFIDDRWRDGVPNRTVTLLSPPPAPELPDERLIRDNIRDVLDGPSTFQAGAASVLVLLRRYLEKLEQLDLEGGYEPRVRLFTRHRVLNTPEGFIKLDDGRIGFRIEALQELDYRGKFVRVRRPGTGPIELGVPRLFMIAQGSHSTDAERLGFKQEDVVVDHDDGRGPVVAQADFLAGLLEVLVGGRLRRRISSEFDENGTEYWVRQIAVGHENDPEVGWCLVQVPDFKAFDPVAAGLVPEGTDGRSPEFFAAYENLVYDFYVQHVADILDMPKEQVQKIQSAYGPKLFTLVERMGDDALIAPNGVVAGDSFGNGHFLTSGGAMTGMVGHSARVYEYWRACDAGTRHAEAIRTLADKIMMDTSDWLHVSAKEYSEAVPINFGAERIAQISAQSGISSSARSAAIDASRRLRHALLPLDPSDWRRLFLRNGKVHSAPLPDLHAIHPALRTQVARRAQTRIGVATVVADLQPETVRYVEALLRQPGVNLGLITGASVTALPDAWHERVVAKAHVSNILNADELAEAVRVMHDRIGLPDRFVTPADELQVPVAAAREILGIAGARVSEARNFRDGTRMRERLEALGLPIARYARVESIEDGLVFGTEIGYYPLVVKPNEGAGADNTYRVQTEDELRELLERLQPSADRPLICEEFIKGHECTLEVITIHGVPAWFSATRFEPELLDVLLSPGTPLTITLPREPDDPADPLLRRMGFAALKALGMGTGLSTIRWHRRQDGTSVIANVSASPPPASVMSLMELVYGADMHRVWANTLTNEVFAPIPRLIAAGGVFFRRPLQSQLGALDAVLAEFQDVVVEARLPEYVLARHAETRVVDEALHRIAAAVRAPVYSTI